MYIYDARERFQPILSAKSLPNNINPYWEGYLNERDYDRLREFDYTVELATNVFFTNIDSCECLSEIFVASEIDEASGNSFVWDLKTELPDNAPKSVRFLRKLHEELTNWLETQRDEIVMSMIEGMSEEEYKAIRKEKDKDLPDEIRNLEYNQI